MKMNAFFEDYFDGVDKIDITNNEQLKVLRSCLTETETMIDDGEDVDYLDMSWLLDKFHGILDELLNRTIERR